MEFKETTTVAHSSTEAEYRSVASTAAEVKWIQPLLNELGSNHLNNR